jgi:hypothetical protein
METLLIRVIESGGQYSVELHHDAGGDQWAPEAIVAEPLARELDPEAAPAGLDSGSLDTAVIKFLEAHKQHPDYGPIGDWLAGLLFRGRDRWCD